MDANSLRRAFTDFFVARGHTAVASAGLIPTHPTAPLFTNAGMNQFVPYMLGEEPAPYPRATSIQKVIRTIDIDIIGTTARHLSFFEMLGNFSFGDYFKEGAIEQGWALATEVLNFDPERIWVTVFREDDEAEQIWLDQIGIPRERVQRLDEEDNFWEMQKGAPGPCGPNSELYYDRGPAYGDEGGPAHGGEDRYMEFWNLVFMQYSRQPDGSLVELPAKNVDTGAGFERNLVLVQDVPTVFETDVMKPVLDEAVRLTGVGYGDRERTDVSLRIIADHARSTTFLVNDGIPPSNDERGYVVRRLIRRFVRHAYQLGVESALVAPTLVSTVVDVMSDAYPDLRANASAITDIVVREEERFRETLRTGTALLEEQLDKGEVSGEVAFKLHDTFGFPIELTQEIASEREVTVDTAGFEAAMGEQRRRAKAARKASAPATADVSSYRQLIEEHGPTEFTGYRHGAEEEATVLAVLPVEGSDGLVEVFLDRTPFYAEGGGQVGDTGTIRTASGVVEVVDTTAALPGLHRHIAKIVEGQPAAGDTAVAAIDAERREHTRRNHSGTHLLHATLREVLGPQLRQQGSYVGPDRLRFDINHHAPITRDQLDEVEDIVNSRVLSNEAVRAYETTMEQAKEMGALMFFGDKYGDIVRVVEAGSHSVELCGGTHVHALGTVGPVKILGEGSIGANLRRVEAVTGTASLTRVKDDERAMERAAALLRAKPDELVDAIERLLERQVTLEQDLKTLRGEAARGEARSLAAGARDGFVVSRRDGLANDQLRDLAIAVRNEPEVKGAVLIGSPDGERVAIVVAVEKGVGVVAGEVLVEAAGIVGGGGNPKAADLAIGGGKEPGRIDDALAAVRARLGLPA